jgi:hypothetical protein
MAAAFGVLATRSAARAGRRSDLGRRVSPLFAALVILIALVLGVLYFMSRLRAYDAAWLAESEQLRAQARMAQTRRGGMSRGSRRPGRAPSGTTRQAGGRVAGRQGPGEAAGGAARQPSTAPKPAKRSS